MKLSKIAHPQLSGSFIRGFWNVISVNIGWMACILGAAGGHHWLGLVVVTILFIIHIILIERDNIRIVSFVALATIAFGFLIDTALIVFGTLEPNRWVMPTPFTTIWDLVIWANFSLALNTSLRFLQKRPFTAAVLGATFAPGTYYAGDRLGALHFSKPIFFSLVWVGIFWCFVMPCLSLIARYFYRPPKTLST